MSGILDIAVSGLNAASQRVANAATNIVNTSSTNYTPQNVVSTANPNGGVTTQTVSAPGTQNDLAANLVSNVASAAVYGANAVVVKTDEKLNKTLLDMIT